MRKRKWLVPFVAIVIVAGLWFTGMIPMQIAKIAGTNQARKHFPEMELEYISVEYSDAFGDYLIRFRDKIGAIYSCVIGPEILPISLGQGLEAIRSSYELWYAGPTPVIVDICDYAQKDGLECIDEEELFFEDEQSVYYFSVVKSTSVIVTYSNGHTETIVTALKTRRITIDDLDRFGIEYDTRPKQ